VKVCPEAPIAANRTNHCGCYFQRLGFPIFRSPFAVFMTSARTVPCGSVAAHVDERLYVGAQSRFFYPISIRFGKGTKNAVEDGCPHMIA